MVCAKQGYYSRLVIGEESIPRKKHRRRNFRCRYEAKVIQISTLHIEQVMMNDMTKRGRLSNPEVAEVKSKSITIGVTIDQPVEDIAPVEEGTASERDTDAGPRRSSKKPDLNKNLDFIYY